MAPTLAARYYCNYYDSGYYDNCYSGWDSWGRWVVLVGIVLFILFIALVFACITSRRRRRAGLAPYYGTGWAAGNKNGNVGYNNQYQQGAAAPPYSPPVQNQYTGNTFNSNEGYYGQQSGIELQPPQNAYNPPRGGGPVYDAPSGPPPKKTAY